MARENKTKYALLGMLLHGPMSGYDMKKFSDSSISHFWSENYGHIYPILKRLEKEAFVKSIVVQKPGKPNRHVYVLTEKGKEVFLEWLKRPADTEIRRNEFLLKLFFAGALPVQDVVRIIGYEKIRNEKVLERYNLIGQEDIKKIDKKGAKRFAYLTLSYGEKLASARAQWFDEVLQGLEREKSSPRNKRKAKAGEFRDSQKK
jgi:PadR family transcriptional regulator AphA